MRNKFTDLIDAGVASFSYKGPEEYTNPLADSTYICRIFNRHWGLLTDSNLRVIDGEYIVTGGAARREGEWDQLVYSRFWGGHDFASSGFCTLGEFLYRNGFESERTVLNGDHVIRLIPRVTTDPALYNAVAVVRTTESRIPTKLPFSIDLRQSTTDLANALGWFVYENTISGEWNGKTYIVEFTGRGKRVKDDTLDQMMKDRWGAVIYLVDFGRYYRMDSDDRAWATVLRKFELNKFDKRDIDGLSPEERFEAMNRIIEIID